MGRSPGGVAVLSAFGVLLCALLVCLFALPSSQGPSLTGQATHGTYPAFSAPEAGFTRSGSQVSVTDTAIYKTAWYSVNGAAWQPLSLSGSAYGASSTWLSGSASAPLPAALSGPGEHYLIVYTCSRTANSWNCHGATPSAGGWQLRILTVAASAPGCDNGLHDGVETGVDCGGSCVSSCPKYLRTFYVSESVGNNAWTGRIPAPNGTDGPWKTISRLNSVTFRPGDGIFFRRGDTWVVPTENEGLVTHYSGDANHPITYGAYGAGAKPIITGRQPVTGWDVPGSWTKNGNVWSRVLSTNYVDYLTYNDNRRGRLWLDGNEALKAQSDTVPTAATPWTHDGKTLYVYAPSDPATYYHSLESSGPPVWLFLINNDYINVNNLDIRGSGNVFQIANSHHDVIEDCAIGMDTAISGLILTQSEDVVIRDNLLDTGDHLIDAYAHANSEDGIIVGDGCSGMDIYNNTFIDWGHTAFNIQVNTPGNAITDIKFHGNFLTAPDIDYGRGLTYNMNTDVGLCTGNEVYDNVFYDHPTQIQISGDGLKFYNNIIDTVTGTSYRSDYTANGLTVGAYGAYANNHAIDNQFYNNIIMNARDYGILLSYTSRRTQNNTFRNNILYNNGINGRYQLWITNSPGVIGNVFENNLLYEAGQPDVVFYEFHLSTAPFKTVDAFNAIDGDHGNAVSDNIGGDPLFVDAANGDFRLRQGSPAIDAGMDVGLPYSGSAPDIGVYESDYTSVDSSLHFIDPVGSDTTGNGSSSRPWRTLAYACSRVQAAGHTIRINAGTYDETQRCNLAVGVSIEGVGDASHIISTYDATQEHIGYGSISLHSPAEGTVGDQSISHLWLDGADLAGSRGISVISRSDVKVHHVTFDDFLLSAVYFTGKEDPWTYPAVYATGNELYNSTITNCGAIDFQDDQFGTYLGNINVQGQDGMLIHDNIITATARPEGRNGDILSAVRGFNKGLKYYRNKAYKNHDEGTGWNFHLEIWNSMGGIEVYDNEFYGGDVGVDFGGSFMYRGAYNYSIWIHDNLFEQSAPQAYGTGNTKVAIDCEGNMEWVRISGNHIKNYPMGVIIIAPSYVAAPKLIEHVYVYNNIMENVGFSDWTWTSAIQLANDATYQTDMTIRDIYIDNNVMSSATGAGTAASAVQFYGVDCAYSDIYVRNNIIRGFNSLSYPAYSGPIRIENGTGTLDNLSFQNNLLFNNGNANDIVYTGGAKRPVHLLESGNREGDPLFVGGFPFDYHLRTGSSAIWNGTDVGLPTDHDGNPYHVPPSIGAYEYTG